MFKRVRWVGIGTVLGAGGSVYAQRKLRRAAQRYLPPEVSARVADRARRIGRDVHEAVGEGRSAMVERESELRAQLDTRQAPTTRQVGKMRPVPRTRQVAKGGGVLDAVTRPLPPAAQPGPDVQPGPDARLGRTRTRRDARASRR